MRPLAPCLVPIVLALLAAFPAHAQEALSADTTEAGRVGPPTGLSPLGFLGQSTGDSFGYSSATIDLDNDGYDDVLVGAPGAGSFGVGHVYAYLGGLAVNPAPDVVYVAESPKVSDEAFGRSVANLGDVNGDGYDDFAVGANGAGSNLGQVDIFFNWGGLGSINREVKVFGVEANGQLGWAVAGAGDLNGDGYDDIVIGAPFANSSGAVYVFFGHPDNHEGVDYGADEADLIINGESGDRLGTSLAGVGDTDGDGYDDLLIGAEGNHTSPGRAYLFRGGPGLTGTHPATEADAVVTGASVGDKLGHAVGAAGDVDGDGLRDLLVGAYAAGQAYLFLGGPALGGALTASAADATFTGEAVDNFGRSTLSPGDVDGDGYDDVAVGAINDDAFGTDAGRVYVFSGGPGLTGTVPAAAAPVRVGGNEGDRLGVNFSAGDLDGDGLPELIAGAPYYDSDRGRAGVLSFTMTGTDLPDEVVYGSGAGESFGFFEEIGDVNGDGYPDLARGNQIDDTAGTDAGAVRVFFGGPSPSSTSMDYVHDVELLGTNPGDQFGLAVVGAGDLNGDTVDDFVVSQGGTGSGRVYVFFGDPALSGTAGASSADAVIEVVRSASIAGAGDVDGDGFDDLLVGNPQHDSPGIDSGVFYVFLGGSGLSGTLSPVDAAYTREGSGTIKELGRRLRGLGDVDGDGFGDIGVGWRLDGTAEYFHDVYFGSPTFTENGLPSPVRLQRPSEDQWFDGIEAVTAGDVNGDGYADIAAVVRDDDAPNSEYVHVYFGGPAFDGAPDLPLTQLSPTLSGPPSYPHFADVNGDGYDDIGYVFTDFDITDKGFVFFGGSDPDGQHDLTLWFSDTEANLVSSTLTAPRDFDGDGYPELLIGDTSDDTNGTNAGALYVFEQSNVSVAPHIVGVRDVPNDQGGFVTVEWTRSGYDEAGSDRVEAYVLERSLPPNAAGRGASGLVWEHVTTVPPTRSPRYAYAAPTYGAESPENPGTTYFRVTALGTGPGEVWRSGTASGASIDNLAPAPPSALATGESPDGDVLLSWMPNADDPDVFGYALYRSDDADCTGDDVLAGTAEGEATDTFEDDDTPFGGDAYFCAATRDVHGNESEPTEAVNANPVVFAALKLVLEGAYESGLAGDALMRSDLAELPDFPLTQPYDGSPFHYSGAEAVDAAFLDAHPDIVDWVLVEIRGEPVGPADARRAVFLRTDGTLLDPEAETSAARLGPAAEQGYHVAVYHRNHLAAMTAFSITLTGSEPATPYDLTLGPANVYGAGAVTEVEAGVWALWGGNGDGDGSVDATDEQTVWTPEVGTEGYSDADYTLDTQVLADDLNEVWVPNVGVESGVPGLARQEHLSRDRARRNTAAGGLSDD